MTKKALITGLTGQDGSYPGFLTTSLKTLCRGAEGQRGRGAEGIELGTLNSPLLPCSLAPLHFKLVRNAGYLAELLLAKGYEVFGLVRRSSTSNLERINHLTGNVQIVSGDLLDQSSLMDVVSECQPDEIYNLASQSYVPLSWTQPMWLMLQQAQPDDYTIASGETHSVKELVECAFNCVGLNWQDYVSVDPAFYRSDEAVQLVGSINKIKTGLGW